MSDSGAPIQFNWDGEAMRPASPFWAKRADAQYIIGQQYKMVEHNDRSINSHNHYFVTIDEAHKNLPEPWATMLPTPKHLRAYALIKANYCDSNILTCSTHEAALQCAGVIRRLDEFALIDIRGSTVQVFFAKSQSRPAMDRKEFQESKEAVLGIIAEMIRVTPKQLSDNAGKAA